MTTRTTKKIRDNITSKGFQQVQTHHEMYWFYLGDKKTSVRTRISHGENEYSDSLLGRMAKQVHLSKKELLEFIDCDLTEKQYTKILVENGVVSP
jgi:hypothetical protein